MTPREPEAKKMTVPGIKPIEKRWFNRYPAPKATELASKAPTKTKTPSAATEISMEKRGIRRLIIDLLLDLIPDR
jgi:hypothetical protein